MLDLKLFYVKFSKNRRIARVRYRTSLQVGAPHRKLERLGEPLAQLGQMSLLNRCTDIRETSLELDVAQYGSTRKNTSASCTREHVDVYKKREI